MDKYLEAEKRLAELMGWKEIQLGGQMMEITLPRDCFGGLDPADGILGLMPRWCRDWSACGPLISEHRIDIDFDDQAVEATYGFDTSYQELKSLFVRVKYNDHPDKDAAVIYAIVQAVIAKLSTPKEG